MINIGFLLDGFIGGGTARVTSIIANNLGKDEAFRCYALAYTRNGKPDIYPTFFPVKYVYEHKISMRNAILKHQYLRTVKKFVKDNDINVLVACGVQFYPVVTLIAKLLGIKSVCWEHINPTTKNDFKFQDHCRVIGAYTSDCNVVLTKSALEIYNKRFKSKRNIQIYNPIDSALLQKIEQYDNTSKKIISVGRLGYQKNFERLIDIAESVFKDNNDWIWDIYGEGPDRVKLEKLINDKNLENRVILRGQVGNLYDCYNEYAFIVMTSRYEGFPMTLLEGAAKGLPMVSFDIPTGPNEIIHDGENGFLCKDAGNNEMIEKIRYLMNDQSLREKMSVKSRKTADSFSVDRIIKEWNKLLKTI